MTNVTRHGKIIRIKGHTATPGVPPPAGGTTVITQDGITATFSGSLTTGYHVDGVSPWVVAPPGGVVLTSVAVTPALALIPGADTYVGYGSWPGYVMVDPGGTDPTALLQGMDDRLGPGGTAGAGSNYSAALTLTLPATIDHYGDGSPKTIWTYRGTDTTQLGGQYNGCYNIVEITVYAANPGPNAIKPTGLYVAGGKPTYTTADIDYDYFTPVTRPVGYTEPDWSLKGYHTRPLVKFGPLTYASSWNPFASQEIYPAYQAAPSGRLILGAISDSPNRVELINRLVRDGLMAYSHVALDMPCNVAIGAFGPGMKGLAYFAGRFLGVSAMCDRPGLITSGIYPNQEFYHEDGCCWEGDTEALYGGTGSPTFADGPPYHDNHDMRDINGVYDPQGVIKFAGTAQSGTATHIQLQAGSAAPSISYPILITGGTGSGQLVQGWHWDNTTKQLMCTPFSRITDGSGLAQFGGSSSIILQASLSPTPISGHYISIWSGTGAGQARIVDAWDSGSKLLTVTVPWTTPPDSTSYYLICATPAFSVAPSSSSTYNTYNSGGYQIDGTRTCTSLAIAVVLAGETVGWGNDTWFEYIKRYIDERGQIRQPWPPEYTFADIDPYIGYLRWLEFSGDGYPLWTELFWNEAESIWPS